MVCAVSMLLKRREKKESCAWKNIVRQIWNPTHGTENNTLIAPTTTPINSTPSHFDTIEITYGDIWERIAPKLRSSILAFSVEIVQRYKNTFDRHCVDYVLWFSQTLYLGVCERASACFYCGIAHRFNGGRERVRYSTICIGLYVLGNKNLNWRCLDLHLDVFFEAY